MYIDIHTHRLPTDPATFALLDCPPDNPLPNPAPRLRFSAGIHPWRTDEPGATAWLDRIAAWAAAKHLSAIGECGLDHLRGAAIPAQLSIFRRHLELSAAYRLPVIIHCVRAWTELLALRREFPLQPWIIHGFSGRTTMAEQLTAAGCILSLGPACLRRSQSATLLDFLREHRFLLETDDENMDIIAVYRQAAVRLQSSMDRLEEIIMDNFTAVFETVILE